MKKLILFFGGLLILNLGVALFLELNLGSDPFTVFTQGLANMFVISQGSANRIITFILLVILTIFSRKSIQIGCFLSLLFNGVFIDLNVWFIQPLQLATLGFVTRIIIFVMACVIIGIGFSLLKCANLGVAPNDVAYLLLAEKLNRPYKVVRMGIDFVCAVVGFMLGGVLGIGTILSVLLIGPIIQFFLEKMERLTNKFLQEA